MRIVIAPDSFKTTATATEAAGWIANGLREKLKTEAEIITIPMADGGEGTSECFSGQRITLPTTDANGRLSESSYIYDPESHTAYIDVAAASGLAAVKDHLRPLTADTYGTGVLIADAQSRGANRIVLGLGGSATTDGGTGILVALGATPLNAAGLPLRPGGGSLIDLASIDTAQLNIPAAAVEWVLLADVTAPATGPTGSAAVFAPQKGASPQEVEQLDQGLAQLCKILDINPTIAGMGAAGGIPIALTWLSTTMHGSPDHVHILPGAKVVADSTNLVGIAPTADVLITGEGKFDAQSAMGKVVPEVLSLAPQARRFVVAGKFVGQPPSGAVAITLVNSSDVQHQLTQAGQDIAKYLMHGAEPEQKQ